MLINKSLAPIQDKNFTCPILYVNQASIARTFLLDARFCILRLVVTFSVAELHFLMCPVSLSWLEQKLFNFYIFIVLGRHNWVNVRYVFCVFVRGTHFIIWKQIVPICFSLMFLSLDHFSHLEPGGRPCALSRHV